MITYGLSGQQYLLEDKAFRCGGEGDIHPIPNHRDRLAKIYHAGYASEELEQKLKLMVCNPPNPKVLSQIAWPLDVLYDEQKTFVGFVMPKLDITDELIELYKYPSVRYRHITMKQKLIVAENICAVISGIHKAGYIFGDFNPHNIGVNLENGHVAFLDTDSYHIRDPQSGMTYRCNVCLDGYVAPELLRACEPYKKDAYAVAPLPTFTKQTDNFALAIHIFRLLMNGYTPFNGIRISETASTASPGVGNLAVKRGSYCFKPGNKPQAAAVPPVEILSEELNDLFTRAFLSGRYHPEERPSAIEWHAALLRYEKQLKPCGVNRAHQYLKTLDRCPYCAADKRYAASLVMPPARSAAGRRAEAEREPRAVTTNAAPKTGRGKKRRVIWLSAIAAVIFLGTIFVTLLVDGNGSKAVADSSPSDSATEQQTAAPSASDSKSTQTPSVPSSQSSSDASSSSKASQAETVYGNSFGGTLSADNTEDVYRYTAQSSDTYIFQSAIQSSSFRISLCIEDADGVTILDTDLSSSVQQASVSLNKGEVYTFTVTQSKGYGVYSISVNQSATSKDNAADSVFSGSFSGEGQSKTVYITPPSSGTYLFVCDSLSADTSVTLRISDDSGSVLSEGSVSAAGDALTAVFTAGKMYTVTVIQSEGFGSYSISAGLQ
ncbi:MAG: hypothetical protein ACC608_07000 [Anaerofustis sp.]